MTRQAAVHARPRRGDFAASSTLRLLIAVAFMSALFAVVRSLWSAAQSVPPPSPFAPPTATPPFDPSIFEPGSPSPPAPPSTALPTGQLPIGIVAGHWGNDSGAVCEDWLYEVDINLAVAREVVRLLRAQGYPADMLEEFDPRLDGYRAQALVSIHADACLYPEASGFKVARVVDSAVPEEEDRLVNCLIDHYRSRTGLAFHSGSITDDMTQYHTFYEIDPATPGAIIEVGFMLADRNLLLNHQDLIAQGIVEGILCFLESP